jgi:hypothetical protein
MISQSPVELPGAISTRGARLMQIPPLSSPIWKDLVSGRVQCEFDTLAAKLLQATLARAVAENPSPENRQSCARMLRDLFAQNLGNPSVQADLAKICTLLDA